MSRLNCSISTDKLRFSIINGSVIAVSDGSQFPQYKIVMCAWIITAPDGKEWIEGGGIVTGILQKKLSPY